MEQNRSNFTNALIEDKYRFVRHAALQIIIFIITIGIFFDTPDTLNLSKERFYGWITYYLFINQLIYVNIYVLIRRYLIKNQIVKYIISAILFTFFSLLLMQLLQDLFYDIKISTDRSPKVAVVLSIVSSLLALSLFIGGTAALVLFKNSLKSSKAINKLKIDTYETELAFLKNQINPHFLFNMLNNAVVLVKEEPKTAKSVLLKLNDLIKYQFNNFSIDSILLKDDIQFLNDYLDLEKIRRDNFNFSIYLDGDIDNVNIHPLLFIPFVENAVKHNHDSKGSFVNIYFSVIDKTVKFKCINSKHSTKINSHLSDDIEKDSNIKIGGLGLENITRRLNLLLGNKYKLETEDSPELYSVELTLNI